MIDQTQFENLKFIENVNLIPEWAFPASYPMHWHIYIELLFIPLYAPEDATISINVNQHIYTLHRGDILLVWPGELHEVLPNDSKFSNALQFSPALLNSRPEFSNNYHMFRQNHLIPYAIAKEFSEEMLCNLQDLIKYHETNDPYRGVEMIICIYRCFITYSRYLDTRHHAEQYSTHTLNELTIQKIHAACSYINSNYTLPLGLEDVAKHIGFSNYYFSRTFKKITDCSFTEYVTQQRIRHAQQLLSDSAQSITDIAFSSGFKSISTFNRVFKEHKGLSPSEFRALYLGHI